MTIRDRAAAADHERSSTQAHRATLMRRDAYGIVCRLVIDGRDSEPFSLNTRPPPGLAVPRPCGRRPAHAACPSRTAPRSPRQRPEYCDCSVGVDTRPSSIGRAPEPLDTTDQINEEN
ncbi:hypothetical protein GCM10022251_35810 [Phytohabitans flavus]|uniref:Uncharacterized protein n=1 Tax=Phytohabitans flavus TaxID=1076124 RepID=A0A6F8XMK5_9ACTN|nr:hypothetical protein Pflav_014620 [Phytohabitans flavus]